MSSLINKVKDAIHSDKDKDSHHDSTHSTTHTGTGTHSATGRNDSLPEGSVGPHSSRAVNAADPTVDSDLDGSRRHGAGAGGLGGTTGPSSGFGTHSTTGPSSGLGGTGTHTGTHTGGFAGRDTSLPEGSVGPHGSRAANAADPRYDSDLDGSRRHGAGTAGGLGGSTGTYGSSTGTHGSGLGGSTGTHGSSTGAYGSTGAHGAGVGGTGPAPGTAGPHKSDMLNKADPRVDSNLDGSKTVGGDKTFSQSNNSPDYSRRDPTDATQVPPSVLQKHVPTQIAHGDETSDHGRRHSVSHQEEHRGL